MSEKYKTLSNFSTLNPFFFFLNLTKLFIHIMKIFAEVNKPGVSNRLTEEVEQITDLGITALFLIWA